MGVAALDDGDALAAAELGAEALGAEALGAAALAEASAETSEGGDVAGAPAHPAARSAIPSAHRAVHDTEPTFPSKVEHA